MSTKSMTVALDGGNASLQLAWGLIKKTFSMGKWILQKLMGRSSTTPNAEALAVSEEEVPTVTGQVKPHQEEEQDQFGAKIDLMIFKMQQMDSDSKEIDFIEALVAAREARKAKRAAKNSWFSMNYWYQTAWAWWGTLLWTIEVTCTIISWIVFLTSIAAKVMLSHQ